MKTETRMVLSEFWICLFLGFFGLGAIPMLLMGVISNVFQFSFVFAFLVAIALIIFFPISAHFNPAVTLALVLFRGFPKKLLLPYTIAQTAGWGIGVLGVFAVYHNLLSGMLAEIAPYSPALFYCNLAIPDYYITGVVMEIALTFFLIVAVFAMLDERFPHRPSPMLFPWAVGFLVVFLFCFGGFTATCINPARDFGPRVAGLIYALINGMDISPIFSGGYWLLYIISPLTGAALGGLFFDKVIVPLFGKTPKAEESTSQTPQ